MMLLKKRGVAYFDLNLSLAYIITYNYTVVARVAANTSSLQIVAAAMASNDAFSG